MIEPTVRTAVASLATGLTAVGLNTVPKDTALPYAVVHRISGTRSATHGGPDGMVTSRLQVDVLAADYYTAKIEASKIYDLQVTPMTDVAKVVLENEIDFDESDVNQYRVTLDFIINHYE